MLAVLYSLSAVAYFTWRLTVFNPDALVFSAVFYVAELFGTVVCFIFAFPGWRRVTVKAQPPERDLKVDVFVTTFNEPVEVIRRTVLGALAIEYPHETWILDDGKSDQVRDLAHELGCRYLTRGNLEGAKAGNLNNAMKHANGNFFALFDADHVPQRDFLTKLLGYFRDPEVAIVQTPQDYFNMDGFQYGCDKRSKLIWHDQSAFHYVGQPGRNHWNAATFCGTSAVLRRSAVDEIGGIPEETVTEDMHAAVKIQRLGYSTVYHAEPLAFGIAPKGLREYLSQRLRWGEGNMQVHRIEGLPFSSGLTWSQRLCYGALAWNYLSAWQKIIYISAPIVLLSMQVPPIVSEFGVFAAFFVPYLLVTYLFYEEIGRGYGNVLAAERFDVARLIASLFATAGLFRTRIRFRVSSKEPAGRIPYLLLSPQILIVALSSGAVLFGIWRQIADPENSLTLWLAILIMMLASLNVYLSSRVICDTVRTAREGEKTYRHVVPVPFRVRSGPGAGHVHATDELSTIEMIFEADAEVLISPGDRLSGELFLPEEALPIEAIVERVELRNGRRRILLGLIWRETRLRDRLDLALHAGRWYRPVVGSRESLRTPYDVLKDFLDTGRLRKPSPPVWQPAIHHSAAAGSRRDKLCYVNESLGSGGPAMIAFGPIEAGEVIDITLATSSDRRLDWTRCRVEAEIIGAVQDEVSLEVVGGSIFIVDPTAQAGAAAAPAERSAQILRMPGT